MTIKGIAQLIFDYADDYNIDIPLRHAKKIHDIIVDKFDHKNFMIVVNGTVRSSWPEVIVNEKTLSDEEIQKALKFFEEAGANVIAYKKQRYRNDYKNSKKIRELFFD